MRADRRVALAALFAVLATVGTAQAPRRIDPDGIRGALVIVGGGGMPDAARARFVELAGGPAARIVVIPTASGRADEAARSGEFDDWLRPWRDFEVADLAALHPAGAEPTPDQAAQLRAATALWFGGGDQSRIADRMLGNAWEELVVDVLRRGGVVGGTSAGAAIQSRVMIAGGRTEPELRAGFDLLPDAIVDQHFVARARQARLERAVALHPGRFGIGIDERTAVVVRGRRIDVVGASTATVVLAATARRPVRTIELGAGSVADLTALRRMARNRSTVDFPGPDVGRPELPDGALVMVGGGALPDDVVARFVELAGGAGARIVMLPTAAPGSERSMGGLAARLRGAGATQVDVLPQRSLDAVTSDAFLSAVDAATGVWFGGGRQWRFVDAYGETPAETAFRGVLARGGVIGGSSAGASIQGEYMPRGDPLGNRNVMAEGYERGFGYLGGVAIDQHVTQRGRLPDLVALVEACPQFLGIGLDEGTALVVRGRVGAVLGQGAVHFVHSVRDVDVRDVDVRDADAPDGDTPRVDRRLAGESYDLVERRAP